MPSIIAIQNNNWFKYATLLMLGITLSLTTRAGNDGKIIIPAGTCVQLQAAETVRSENKRMPGKRVHQNDVVNFQVTNDVVVDNQVVIKAGTPVAGTITRSNKPKAFGKPGTLSIEFSKVQAVDSTVVLLADNSLTLIGKNKSEMVIGLAVCLGCFLTLTFFALLALKGDPAIICEDNTKTECITAKDMVIKL